MDQKQRPASPLSEGLLRILACPSCGGELRVFDAGAACSGCGTTYRRAAIGMLDLRLQKPRAQTIAFELGVPLAQADIKCAPLAVKAPPDVDFSLVEVPRHMTRELLSYFPKARSKGSLALDIGCGAAIHRAICEHAGFEYVGLDYDSERATLLGDAHAAPFKNDSFEFVLSVAMLHLVQYPWLVAREAHRVLKPQGRLVGTVAFLEPFHSDGYYHHTHLGTLNTLRSAGFRVEVLAPSVEWTVLVAQAQMALFPGMPRTLARAIVRPVDWLHRAWWARVSRADPDRHRRVRNTTGAFSFVATKDHSALGC